MFKNAYIQSTRQLTELLQDTYSVNITTNLWSLRNNKSYIGVTVEWIDSKD